MKVLRVFEDRTRTCERIEHWLSQEVPNGWSLHVMNNKENWWSEIENSIYALELEPEKRLRAKGKMLATNEVWLVDLDLREATSSTIGLFTRYYKASRFYDRTLRELDSNFQTGNTTFDDILPGLGILAYAKQSGIPIRVISQGANISYDEFKTLLSYLILDEREPLNSVEWSFEKNYLDKKVHTPGSFPNNIKREVNNIWQWARNPYENPLDANSLEEGIILKFILFTIILILLALSPLYFQPELVNNGTYWTIAFGIVGLILAITAVILAIKMRSK